MDSGDNSTKYRMLDIGGSNLKQFYLDTLERDFFEGRKGIGRYVSDIFTFSNGGMQLWGDVTNLPHWYQTHEEISLLQRWGSEIAKHVSPGASLIDLGSGDVKKIVPLLDCIEALQLPLTYYSVDLSQASIVRGLEKLSKRYKFVTLIGLWGTFDDARAYLEGINGPRFLVCLGAEIGNDTFESAVSDLSSWALVMKPDDRFLLGIDSSQNKAKIWRAYHDSDGLFERFIRTGMTHTNAVLGHEWFKNEDWSLDGEFRDDPLVHRFVFTAVREVSCAGGRVVFSPRDHFSCYESHRNTPALMRAIFQASGLRAIGSWEAFNGDCQEFLLAVEN